MCQVALGAMPHCNAIHCAEWQFNNSTLQCNALSQVEIGGTFYRVALGRGSNKVALGGTLQCNALHCAKWHLVAHFPKWHLEEDFSQVALGRGSSKVEKWRRLTATCCCTILIIIATMIEKYYMSCLENMRHENVKKFCGICKIDFKVQSVKWNCEIL